MTISRANICEKIDFSICQDLVYFWKQLVKKQTLDPAVMAWKFKTIPGLFADKNSTNLNFNGEEDAPLISDSEQMVKISRVLKAKSQTLKSFKVALKN